MQSETCKTPFEMKFLVIKMKKILFLFIFAGWIEHLYQLVPQKPKY